MKAPKVFCSRLPINQRELGKLEKALKGLVAGIIAVWSRELAKSKGVLIEVGVFLEWQDRCFGSCTINVGRKLATNALFDGVLGLMDAVRASSDEGNREIRATVTVLEEKD